MTEVSLDDAVVARGLSLDDEVTELLNAIIAVVIEKYNDNKLIPIDMLTLSVISASEDFRTLQCSKVQCFTYILRNLETIINGEFELLEDISKDIEYQAEDFAASHMRVDNRKAQSYADHINCLHEKIIMQCNDFHVRLQHQTDTTYCMGCQNGISTTEYHESIEQEIYLLFNVGNYEKAVSKVRRNKLYKRGLWLLSFFPKENLDDIQKSYLIRKQLFEGYLDFMDNEGGDFEYEVDRDRENANIIVDSRCDKGFRNGKFYVNDLMSGLKLAQNKGGVIFLENGDYTTDTFFGVKLRTCDKEITIIGSSTSECSIHGTIKIQAENAVKFKRVKLEVGSSPECKDAIFITKGFVTFTECLIEATVNTLFYVFESSKLCLELCIVDGLESCQRCVSVSGKDAEVSLLGSWVRDMFSVVTITEEDAVTSLDLSIKGCEIDSVQTAVTATKVGVHSISMVRNAFNMVLYSDEDPSHVLSLSGLDGYYEDGCYEHSDSDFVVDTRQNIIKFQHIEGKAFQVNQVPSVLIAQARILTEDGIDRKLAICEAVSGSSLNTLEVDRIEVIGFRVGVSVLDTQDVNIRKSSFDKCSIGIYSPKQKARTRGVIKLEDTKIKTTYYGFLVINKKVEIKLASVKFMDVPKPLLLNKASVDTMSEDSCSYILTRDYTSAREFRVLEEEMNLQLATQENIAHRTAYDRDEVQMVFRYDALGYSNDCVKTEE